MIVKSTYKKFMNSKFQILFYKNSLAQDYFTRTLFVTDILLACKHINYDHSVAPHKTDSDWPQVTRSSNLYAAPSLLLHSDVFSTI